jgi:hypothetical protein
MIGSDELRHLVLSLPEVEERDHHGMPSFRVGGKIIATVPDPGHLRVMAGDAEIRAAIAEDPETYRPFHWGKRLACVVVDLARVDPAGLEQLVAEAWLGKAPARLARAFRGRQSNS